MDKWVDLWVHCIVIKLVEYFPVFKWSLTNYYNIALLCFVVPEVEMVHNLTFSGNEECTFDRRKGQGFVLYVPKEAVSSNDCTVEMKSQVVTQSKPEFIFPEGSKLVNHVVHPGNYQNRCLLKSSTVPSSGMTLSTPR